MTIIKTIFFSFLLVSFHSQTLHPALLTSADSAKITLDANEKLKTDGILPGYPIVFTLQSGDPLMTGFSIKEDAFKDIKVWQIQILDSGGRKVSFLQGKENLLSLTIPWSGFSNDGEVLPDGFYDAQFVWMDSQKNIHKTPKAFFSLSNPAEIKYLSNLRFRLDFTLEGLIVSMNEMLVFEPGQFKIQKEALPDLKKIVRFLRAYPKNKVVVRGHTDSIGSVKNNLILSRKRAFYIYQYLVRNGTNPRQLTYEGLGFDSPIASNATKEGRAKNRRVDIVVLKNTI